MIIKEITVSAGRKHLWSSNALMRGLKGLGIVWAFAFLVCTATTVYNNHAALTSANSSLRSRNETLSNQANRVPRLEEQLRSLQLEVEEKSQVKAKNPWDQAGGTNAIRREVLTKISEFMTSGNALRTELIPGVSYSQSKQEEWASSVQKWSDSVENYLKTIPRGDIYLARFKNEVMRGIYPAGAVTTPEAYNSWDLLVSDLSRLEEFTQDQDLGKP